MWKLCCTRENGYLDVLQNTALTPLQHSIMKKRYIDLVHQYSLRCFFLSILFHSTRGIVTVGSLIVPALLSIQYTDATPSTQGSASMSYQIYWVTWVISLLVTTCNGIQSIFKIEKKYYFLHTVMEQLRSEGWQYLELSGRYSGYYTPKELPTHENQFTFFCAQVEKIKMKQVEEEYWKVTETQQQQTTQSSGTNGGTGQADASKSSSQQQRRTIDQLIPPSSLRANVIVDNEITESHTHVTIREGPEAEEKKSEDTIENPPEDGEKSNTQIASKEARRRMPVSIVLSESTDTRPSNVSVPSKSGLSS